MRHIHLGCMILAFILTALATAGLAGRNPDLQVAVHVMAGDGFRTCSRNFPEIATCVDIETTYGGCGAVDIFPVFFNVTEYKGVEYGLTWPGSGSCVFTSCSDISIGNITQPGDGISQAWLSCQYDVGPAVPGFGRIYVSGPGFVSMIDHPDIWAIRIEDCLEAWDEPIVNCRAGFCGESGDEACWLWPTMGLDKADDAGTGCVNPGDTLVYTISYDNPYWQVIEDVSIVDYLPTETDYVSASHAGVYDGGMHTVTWQVGTVPVESTGSVELVSRLRTDMPPVEAVLNTCEIRTGDYTIRAAWDSTQTCYTSAEPTTWSGIKSMFR